MKTLKLKISDTQFLQATYENIGQDDCAVCVHCDIDYVDEAKNISIRFGYEFISTLCYFIAESGRIQKLIAGEMVKDPLIDLGFQLNEYWQGNINIKGSLKYHFESNSHKKIRPYYNSWLYNNECGEVIFEITPYYPWFGTTKKSNPEKISYKIWIQSYKSILKVTIPKENLEQWIDQATALKKTLV